MHRLYHLYIDVNKKLSKDMNNIIQAFINFYGSEHSEYIINKIKNSKIIWYDDTSAIENDFRNNIITSISDDELSKILQKRKKEAFLQSSYIDELDILVLPLSYDLTQIIHEINHKIASHIISIEPLIQINGISYTVEKNQAIKYDNDINEAINQKMTLEIIEELKRLGLEIDVTPSWQEHLFPVINTFYDTFKSDLKEVNVTGDLEKFRQLLGVEYYSRFSQLIFMCGFKTRRNISKEENIEFSTDKINSIDNLVSNMKIHYDDLSLKNNKKGL